MLCGGWRLDYCSTIHKTYRWWGGGGGEGGQGQNATPHSVWLAWQEAVVFPSPTPPDMQCNCAVGLMPLISRAWLTVDSTIYIWSYEDG